MWDGGREAERVYIGIVRACVDVDDLCHLLRLVPVRNENLYTVAHSPAPKPLGTRSLSS